MSVRIILDSVSTSMPLAGAVWFISSMDLYLTMDQEDYSVCVCVSVCTRECISFASV